MLLIDMHIFLIIIVGISFVIYGLSIFSSQKMKDEFIRFKLKEFTYIIGTFEILGGVGLLIGIYNVNFLISSSFCLAFLMLLGILARLRVRDNLMKLLPALLFLFLNTYIFIDSLKNIL